MLRGELWLADLDPARTSEAAKRRPVVIVSNDHANAAASHGRGVVTVVPITSNVTRVLSFQVLLAAEVSGLRIDSKAQAEQVRSISVDRLEACVGRLSAGTMAAIDDALRLHLDL